MTTQLAPTPVFKAFDNNGNPLASGQLFSYIAGTSTPQATWVDFTQTTQNTNPVILNARGECSLWLDPTLTYKFVLTDSQGNQIWTVDQIQGLVVFLTNFLPTILTQNYLSTILYPQTAFELAAGITPTSFLYQTGDLRRYGAVMDGVTDNTVAINQAITVAQAGLGFIRHPGGNCAHASQILAGNNFSVIGFDRTACVFTYTGGAANSGWRITNNGTGSPVINSSGFGRVNFTGVTLTTAVANAIGAALEINACGFSFYEIKECRFTGTYKYGLILDGAEVSHVHHNIFDNAGTLSAHIWLVNGAERTGGSILGLTNSITINDNQLNGATYGVADDGGSDHYILYNNLNGNSIPIRIAGANAFSIRGNEMENLGVVTGEANIDFLTLGLAAVNVGPCRGGSVEDNFFGADMAASSSSLKFNGSAFHQGITVKGNWFRNNLGRSADIDVTQLANGFCAENFVDPTVSSGQHYTGTHNDGNGSVLWPPQNGYPAGFAEAAYLFGDARFPVKNVGGQIIGSLGSTIATKLKGTQAMAGTTAAVSFGVTLSGSTYQVALCANLTGGPFWVTSKSTTGFTINAGSSFTGNVDWIVEQ